MLALLEGTTIVDVSGLRVNGQFGHAPSKRFTSPGLGCGLYDLGIVIQFLLGTIGSPHFPALKSAFPPIQWDLGAPLSA